MRLFTIFLTIIIYFSFSCCKLNAQELNSYLWIKNQQQLDTLTQYEAIYGNLLIGDTIPNDIHDLTNLKRLKFVYSFDILYTNLKNLHHLDSLQYVPLCWDCNIKYNDSLLNLDGLGNIILDENAYTKLYIEENKSLERLTNFKKLSGAYDTDIHLKNNPKLTTLEGLDSLKSIGNFKMAGNQLKSLKGLNSLQHGRLFIEHEDSLQHITDFEPNDTIQGYRIEMSECNTIKEVKFNQPIYGLGSMNLSDLSNLENIDFENVKGKLFSFSIGRCPKISQLYYPSTDSLRLYVNANQNLVSVECPNISKLYTLWVDDNDRLKQLHFPNIGDTTLDIENEFYYFPIIIINNDSLESIRIPHLKYRGYYDNSIQIKDNPRLNELYLPNLKTAGELIISGNGLKKIEHLDSLESLAFYYKNVDDEIVEVAGKLVVEQGVLPGIDSSEVGYVSGFPRLKKAKSIEINAKGPILSDFDSLMALPEGFYAPLKLTLHDNTRVLKFPVLDSCNYISILNSSLKELPIFGKHIKNLQGIGIFNNDSLLNLNGLKATPKLFTSFPNQTIEPYIWLNPMLSDCSLLCQWQENGNVFWSPPIGAAYIDSNAIQCLNLDAVLAYCDTILAVSEPQKQVWIYPNPVVNLLNIDVEQVGSIEELIIINVQGGIVSHLFQLEASNTLPISHWSPGIYFVLLRTSEGKWYREKMIKIGGT